MATKQDFIAPGNQMYVGRDWFPKFFKTDSEGVYEDLTGKEFYGTVRSNLLNASDPDDANVNADGSFRIRWKAGTAGQLYDGTVIASDGSAGTAPAGTYDQSKVYYGHIYVKAETSGQLIVPGVVAKDIIGANDTKLKWQYELVMRDTAMTLFDSEGTPDLIYVAQSTVALTKDQTVQVPDGGEYRAVEDYSDTGTNFLVDYKDVTKFAPINTITGTIETVLYGSVGIQLRIAHRLSSNALK